MVVVVLVVVAAVVVVSSVVVVVENTPGYILITTIFTYNTYTKSIKYLIKYAKSDSLSLT
jgi:phosphate starvation-inducible membrane PsiE